MKLRFVRVDELGITHGHWFVHDSRKLLGENDCDGSRITRINWDRKGAGVAIVSVDVAFGFPDTVGVARRMILKTNQQNFRPEILVECVLGLNHGEVIARGNDAAVEDYQIVFTGAKNHRALAPSHRADQKSSANDRIDFFR